MQTSPPANPSSHSAGEISSVPLQIPEPTDVATLRSKMRDEMDKLKDAKRVGNRPLYLKHIASCNALKQLLISAGGWNSKE